MEQETIIIVMLCLTFGILIKVSLVALDYKKKWKNELVQAENYLLKDEALKQKNEQMQEEMAEYQGQKQENEALTSQIQQLTAKNGESLRKIQELTAENSKSLQIIQDYQQGRALKRERKTNNELQEKIAVLKSDLEQAFQMMREESQSYQQLLDQHNVIVGALKEEQQKTDRLTWKIQNLEAQNHRETEQLEREKQARAASQKQKEAFIELQKSYDCICKELEDKKRALERSNCEKEKFAELQNSYERLWKELQEKKQALEEMKSNTTGIPWLAGIQADFLTYDLEKEARKLEWGSNIERAKKVKSIRELRNEMKDKIKEAKTAVYQLEYLKTMFPGIEDFLETDYQDLDMQIKLTDHDYTRDYLSKEEWNRLEPEKRDQMALDRYIASHTKSDWQIGRDYELFVGYRFQQKGYSVEPYGSLKKMEDLGRDLIAKRGGRTMIVQCKYWSKQKTIHEKHIFQLYGTTISYSIEQHLPEDRVAGVFVTNIQLSPMAKQVAKRLNIQVVENLPFQEFPRIKCNIGHGEYGVEKIYHLPMDQQYDTTRIDGPGECYAYTVQEAVEKGFRRAFRWHGN